jgi:molybdenum cofactor cytidylyltransferase
MKVRVLSVGDSVGRVLSTPIFRLSGKKLLAKGHIVSQDDADLLQSEGLDQVWVTELDEDEVSEEEAVLSASASLATGSLEIRLATGGRANLVASENSCVVIDEDLLRQVNSTSSMVVATVNKFSYAKAGQRVAVVKSAPFAVGRQQLNDVVGLLNSNGPLMRVRPIRNARVALLYTDPLQSERGRTLFENVMRQRLANYELDTSIALCCVEDEAKVANALGYLMKANPTVVIVASTTAPANPDDVVGRAMLRVGCAIERFLAPVEPGNLLLLAYRDEIPVISAPGCYRSAKRNVLDLLLPPLLSGYRLSGWELAGFGSGGLLTA